MTAEQPTRRTIEYQRRTIEYQRVSRSGGRNADELERNTLREQHEHAMRRLPRDAEIVETLRDIDVSGALDQRPGLDELWRRVDAGEVDVVIVGYLSRFGRSSVQIQMNVERLRKAGVAFISAREGLEIDPRHPNTYQGVMLALLASMAEIERERLREGLASANSNALERGAAVAIPYGYRREDGPGSPLLLDDELDEYTGEFSPTSVVRRIFAMRIERYGASSIADALSDDSVPTPTMLEHLRGARRDPGAERWSHNSIRGIVETHSYKGVIPRWQYESVGKRRRRIPGSLELLPAEHDELVDAGVWEAAQFRSEPAIRNGSMGGSLLEGIVRCATCSQMMNPTKGSHGQLAYKCKGRRRGCERSASIARHLLDEYVERVVIRGDESHGLYWTAQPLERTSDELERVRAELADARVELAAFLEHASVATLRERYVPELTRRSSVVERLEQRERELERSLATHETPPLRVWETLTLRERNEALSDALDAVVVLPAPKRGWRGLVEQRVGAIVQRGLAPLELGHRGRVVPNRPFPLERD